MAKKTIAIIGRGTNGALSVLHFLKHTDWDIQWIYDPKIPVAAVGEATTLTISSHLHNTLDFRHNDLININGTVKQGVFKNYWSNNPGFYHSFPVGNVALHFSANEMQEFIFNKLKNYKRIKVIEKHVENPEDLDVDHVMVCTGTPKNLNEKLFTLKKSIPVNSAYVVQCEWEFPRFLYSLQLAKKYGWVFGTPLQNRIAIGYIFNRNENSLDEIKEDINSVFKEYNLKPSTKTIQLDFTSYYRQNNFSSKVVYNGNASWFLEPLEATASTITDFVNRLAFDLWNGNLTVKECQQLYEDEINDAEGMILLHYMAGSIYNTNFWDLAKTKATNKIYDHFKNNTVFAEFVKQALENPNIYIGNCGTWGNENYKYNLKKLGLEKEIKKLGGLL